VRGQEVVHEIESNGGTAVFEVADIGDAEQVERLAERVLERLRGVDILVNSAGVFIGGDATDATAADWEASLRINATGTFLMCQAFGRHMIERGRGKIVNFSSTDAFVGVPQQLAYCASKGAVLQLTRTLGVEWIKHGVNVNGIAPSDFATPMVAELLSDPDYREWISRAIPVARVGEPEEIVGAVLYLSSRASDMVVGHTVLVDGGRTAI
jgi:NAD(P)-dependent dehydrogenase (short-subunit alcohol dehydrogenase family)